MIPDEAVEAAARALRDAFDWGVDGFEEQAKRALEAAAPHLMATAWDDAYEKGRDRGEWEAAPVTAEPKYENPHRTSNPDVGPRCPACRVGLVTHEPLDPHCIDNRKAPDA